MPRSLFAIRQSIIVIHSESRKNVFQIVSPAQTMSSSSQSIHSSPPTLPSRSLADIVRVPSHPEMRVLDRSAFKVKVPIISAKVDVGRISEMRRHPLLRGCVVGSLPLFRLHRPSVSDLVGAVDSLRQLMDLPKTRGIVSDPANEGVKLLRLRAESAGPSDPITGREILILYRSATCRDP